MSKPPSASTSLYFDHSHLTNSTSSPSSLKKPFSIAQKIGASQVIPMYPTRIFVGLLPGAEDPVSCLLQPTVNSATVSATAEFNLARDMLQYWRRRSRKKS